MCIVAPSEKLNALTKSSVWPCLAVAWCTKTSMSEKVKPLVEHDHHDAVLKEEAVNKEVSREDIMRELKLMSVHIEKVEHEVESLKKDATSRGKSSLTAQSRDWEAQIELLNSMPLSIQRQVRGTDVVTQGAKRRSLGPVSSAISEWTSYDAQCTLVVYVVVLLIACRRTERRHARDQCALSLNLTQP